MTNGLCLISGKVWRTAGMLVQKVVGGGCNMASSHWWLLGPGAGAALVTSFVLCPDLKTLVGVDQGNKALAALSISAEISIG